MSLITRLSVDIALKLEEAFRVRTVEDITKVIKHIEAHPRTIKKLINETSQPCFITSGCWFRDYKLIENETLDVSGENLWIIKSQS